MGRERCKNCKNISWVGLDLMYAICDITKEEIPWPLFMGGSKKCECYERKIKMKEKFKYPTKRDSGMNPKDREIIEAYKRGETPASVLENCERK